MDHAARYRGAATVRVTLSGSFNRHREELRAARSEFEAIGAEILSPPPLHVRSEHQRFVYLQGDPSSEKRLTEDRHLDAIAHSDLLWVVATNGYVGRSTAFELGFAHARAVPVFGPELPSDATLRHYVRRAARPREAVAAVRAESTRGTTVLLDAPKALSALAQDLQRLRQGLERSPLDAPAAQAVRDAARRMRLTLGELAAPPQER